MVAYVPGDVFDDEKTHLMGRAFDYICAVLEPTDDLRRQVAAAVLEAATYGHTDQRHIADAALELVYIDTIEADLLEA